ncbi:phosphoribosylglycinamide formyltransferase [Oceanobacillus rekensis]|uniref:phosphoribosylglycinamide formyltransferase n=1 Tax=Oceanobacillus rekensis TaxID=937927 RepID=UPI000B431B88|nr:phosphoribosylglycinamide formyltransferase [Oceanobacillus rekensis]
MSKIKAAVFASGTGSNFEAMMESVYLACDIALLVCDKPGAIVLEKAEKYGVPTFVFDAKQFPSKADYEKVILEKLEKMKISWIFLAGYMRIAGPTLLRGYEGRIVNIHPSLLPAFPGMDAIGQAFQAGVEATGVTVHYIDEGIDTGPIIAQETVAILKEDTEESLKKRIQKVEHELYPKVINQLLEQK